jgi:cytochrome b561
MGTPDGDNAHGSGSGSERPEARHRANNPNDALKSAQLGRQATMISCPPCSDRNEEFYVNQQHFTRPAILLHWLIALIIAVAFPVGLIMSDMPVSPTRIKIFVWHKWAGLTVLWLAFVRIGWRATHAAPVLPDSVPAWQARISKLVQWAIYALIFAVPLSGWSYSSAAGYGVVYLNLIPLPNLVAKNKELADQLKDLHEFLNWTLFALVAMHAAAALKHHFIDRDGVLLSMLRSRS